jgi:predicted phosphoribosyltransferase/pimeloyl-ACP methyl ester carboxylesterase
MVFEDRRDAGRRLAPLLATLAPEQPIIVALPRGGVPVAVEVASALGAPLETLTVRKLGVPWNPELGIGAVAEDGSAVIDQETMRQVGMSEADLERTLQRELLELRRRTEAFRDGRPPLDVRGRTVIVVDDGLATGLSDLAAVRALRRRGAARIVVAAPVASGESVAMLRREADEVVCHTVPERLMGVGGWYRDFSQVSDEEVLRALAEAAAGAPAAAPVPRDGPGDAIAREVTFELGAVRLRGDLSIPPGAGGLIVFAHGSGSSRLSPRNQSVARALNDAGLGTLLFDLLSEEEAARRAAVFDIELLAERLEAVTRWALADEATRALPVGYFGASTGAAAAVRAAAALGERVRALVSRGGRPDLAAADLPAVMAPTLLIVGDRDREVLTLNRRAAALLRCPHRIALVPGAGHLFEEPGALEAVAGLAIEWFETHLGAAGGLAASGTDG